jgi:hypothetical protein
MASQIDPTKPLDGVPAAKADLRGNLQAAKTEIEALQSGKADLGHTHTIADVSDAGALAGKNRIAAGDIDPGAVTASTIGGAAVTTPPIANGAVTLAKLGTGSAGRLLGFNALGAPTEFAQGAAGGLDADLLDGQQASAFAAAGHGHTLAQISDAGSLAGKNSVGPSEIDNAAVDADKIASSAVTAAKIAGLAVGNSKLANTAVTSSKLAANAVTSDKIADGAVTTAKVVDGAVTQAKLAAAAVGAAQLQDGIPISMDGALLSGPELRGQVESSPVAAIGSGALTLDLADGSVFEVTLTEDVILLILANPPSVGKAAAATLIVRQDATGGRAVTWPASVKWAGGIAPTITAVADAVDVCTFVTMDGGTTWYGFLGGQDFS